MDGAQFAKMLSDKHLFELNRMEYSMLFHLEEFLLFEYLNQPLQLWHRHHLIPL